MAPVRLERSEPSRLAEPSGRPAWRRTMDQFRIVLAATLAGTAIVAAALGDLRNAALVGVVLFVTQRTNVVAGSTKACGDPIRCDTPTDHSRFSSRWAELKRRGANHEPLLSNRTSNMYLTIAGRREYSR